ncbi:MAG: hypothetical protein R2720_03425 [Candidatus Nanopelagicales bacterium]
MSDELTRTERADLQRVARMRAKVARGAIEAVKAKRLAEFERELLAHYAVDDSAWSELTATAEAQVQQTDDEIARRCEELGIRPEFRPRLTLGWRSAGENAVKSRREELRRLARYELEAAGKTARQRIDAGELEAVTAIVAVGMGAQARELLEAMPTPEQLVPVLDLGELEARRLAAGCVLSEVDCETACTTWDQHRCQRRGRHRQRCRYPNGRRGSDNRAGPRPRGHRA